MKLVSKLALAAALAVPCFTSNLVRADAPASSTEPVKYNSGALTFSGGVDLATAYYFRGYLQENRGFIVEPYFGVNVTLIDADDYKIGLTLNTWNSVHSKHTGADNGSGSPDMWYENDLIAAVPITIKSGIGDFTLTPTYYVYQYPNGAFHTIQEAQLLVNYDDSKAWKMINPNFPDWFHVNPYILAAYELQDGNGTENGYIEFGIVPSYTFSLDNGFKLPISVPVTLGTGYDNYYTSSPTHGGGNDFLGYVSIGIQTNIPLNDILHIDAKYGTLGFSAGGYYMSLLSDSVEVTNHDESNVFWGKVGLTYAY